MGMCKRRARKRIRSRSNGDLPFAVTKRSSSADELDDHPDSESVSTSSVSSSNVHHLSVHGLQRQIQNLSTNPRNSRNNRNNINDRQIPSNLTPPAGRLSLRRIDCEFVASPTGFSSQTPPGIGRDRHMPSLNLHDVQRRNHYSEPMGDRRRHTMNGRNGRYGISGISGVQRTGSISITRSKPLSIHKGKRKAKFDLDFHGGDSFKASDRPPLITATNTEHLMEDEPIFDMEFE